jgi:hypothetical protein
LHILLLCSSGDRPTKRQQRDQQQQPPAAANGVGHSSKPGSKGGPHAAAAAAGKAGGGGAVVVKAELAEHQPASSTQRRCVVRAPNGLVECYVKVGAAACLQHCWCLLLCCCAPMSSICTNTLLVPPDIPTPWRCAALMKLRPLGLCSLHQCHEIRVQASMSSGLAQVYCAWGHWWCQACNTAAAAAAAGGTCFADT